MSKRSHYPEYDVLTQREHWDEHTRQIVVARTIRERDYSFLELEEAELLRAICAQLIDDHRAEVIQFVIGHIDETLHQQVGEGQRKPGVPAESELVRGGLALLNKACLLQSKQPYYQLPSESQHELIRAISESRAQPASVWDWFPQTAWFQKLLKLTVEAYYSHPTIWSEIGYGGPAYPRGYVRAGVGQLDPWEAKRSNEATQTRK